MNRLISRETDDAEETAGICGLDPQKKIQTALLIPDMDVNCGEEERYFRLITLKNICMGLVDSRGEGITFPDTAGRLVVVMYLKDGSDDITESLFTDQSVTAFKNAIAGLDLSDARTQSEADNMIAKINQAVALLRYKENYADPWNIVNGAATKEDVFCDIGYTESLFTIPGEVADAVIVTYSSDNEEVAVYETVENGNGIMRAKAAGTVVLTVRVGAKSDGYAMEYATVVTVGKEPSQPGEDPEKPGGDQTTGEDGKTDGSDQTDNSGNSTENRSPQTGDTTNFRHWSVMAVVALTAAGYVGIRRKRRS